MLLPPILSIQEVFKMNNNTFRTHTSYILFYMSDTCSMRTPCTPSGNNG